MFCYIHFPRASGHADIRSDALVTRKLRNKSTCAVIGFIYKHLKISQDFVTSLHFIGYHSKLRCRNAGHDVVNDEMIYEIDHICTADMKSSEAMILAVMNAIFEIA